MKITKEQIKKIIKEELNKILGEQQSNIQVLNLRRIEDMGDGEVPLVYDGQLINVWGEKTEALMYPSNIEWGESVADEIKDKLINATDNDIHNFFEPETLNQYILLLKSLDENFEGIPVGNLSFGDNDSYYLPIEVKWSPGVGLEVLNSESLGDLNDVDVDVGYGMPDVENYLSMDFNEGDGYILGYDAGDGGYGSHDIAASMNINLAKVLADIQKGRLGFEISGGHGSFVYTIRRAL